MKEPEIVTRIDFNKQDIVTVAMAKIEALIRRHVRDFKAQRDDLTVKIEKAEERIKSIGENNPPKDMVKKFNQIEKAFKIAGISKTIGVGIKFNLSGPERNDYHLAIFKKDEKDNRNHESIGITFKSISYTNAQSNLVGSIEKMKEQKDKSITDGVTWKSKLSDMSAVERQMRAKVVEAELNKTEEGKALIDVLTKGYENTLKLIEM